ncbi:MAG TPA: L,D-transpeptidase family protein [Stellaceae bacterium]|nr:L,D-transpeptidase family protein [Stellaceae bacterium]
MMLRLLLLAFLGFILTTSLVMAKPDRILVKKSHHELLLLDHGRVLKRYKVALGGTPVGRKRTRGDHRTPEGLYVIDAHNEASHYHLSLHVSYPNQDDRRRARARHADPGGDIFIHGLPNTFPSSVPLVALGDWTDGCIAVSNADIEEIAALVEDGTVIEIRP